MENGTNLQPIRTPSPHSSTGSYEVLTPRSGIGDFELVSPPFDIEADDFPEPSPTHADLSSTPTTATTNPEATTDSASTAAVQQRPLTPLQQTPAPITTTITLSPPTVPGLRSRNPNHETSAIEPNAEHPKQSTGNYSFSSFVSSFFPCLKSRHKKFEDQVEVPVCLEIRVEAPTSSGQPQALQTDSEPAPSNDCLSRLSRCFRS